MWAHYKETFFRVQLMIALITALVFFGLGHLWLVSATFFVVMQLGSFVGAMWASRLKRKLQPRW
jgi:Flp pilus assembly protein TadB